MKISKQLTEVHKAQRVGSALMFFLHYWKRGKNSSTESWLGTRHVSVHDCRYKGTVQTVDKQPVSKFCECQSVVSVLSMNRTCGNLISLWQSETVLKIWENSSENSTIMKQYSSCTISLSCWMSSWVTIECCPYHTMNLIAAGMVITWSIHTLLLLMHAWTNWTMGWYLAW